MRSNSLETISPTYTHFIRLFFILNSTLEEEEAKIPYLYII
jgi:hypothetical protein